MQTDLKKILDQPSVLIAVVGASDQRYKYGSLIYRRLKDSGYRVFPVNPNRPTVDGDICYPSVLQLPEKPDLVNIITPPEVTLQVLEDCLKADCLNVWLQPGASDAEIIRYLQIHPFQWIAGDCIMFYIRQNR